ncbi:hypothetical protein [Flammeovirga aprica]|uniref:DUF2141 domain-containing protein n=1 Tax=Flammeovirga aprica JL-4 TaxID=694437 RepID=A0A7X9RVP1_9BACT|nr:hypothetical protein [Flammeovirga aprica]NME69548.1 hypothetical protein [Flammeovirga aprica JL-4]
MLKFISKLILFISLPLFIISCSSDSEEEIIPGDISFWADSNSGFLGDQAITIVIYDNKNSTEIARGVLNEEANDPQCGGETKFSIFTVQLSPGTYIVQAFEDDSEAGEGAWFNGPFGQEIEVIGGSCRSYRMGDDPFEAQRASNARTKGVKFYGIYEVQ